MVEFLIPALFFMIGILVGMAWTAGFFVFGYLLLKDRLFGNSMNVVVHPENLQQDIEVINGFEEDSDDGEEDSDDGDSGPPPWQDDRLTDK